MRADSHYVDSLDRFFPASTVQSRRADDERASDVPTAAKMVPASGGPKADRVPAVRDGSAIAELTRCLRTLEMSEDLLGEAGSPLTRSVALRLIRAENRRAICFLQAVRVMRDEVCARPKRLSVQDVVTRALQAAESERSLRNIPLKPQLTLCHSSVNADEDLLIGALSSVLLATFALVEGTNAPVSVSARVDPQADFMFVATQDAVGAPPAWAAVALEDDPTAQDGDSAALLLGSARRSAEACGGRMSLTTRACGTDIHIVLPTVSW